ncbi:MAG TPA: SurA N-terminal domain-containing protein [Euzebyales bacterium]|nr:SurA N-terminal domain-containing protein [Euzebyales bacterium]
MTAVARRLAIVLVALASAACSLTNTGNPSVAAVVGDERIPTSTVEENFDAQRENPAIQQDTTGQASFDAQAQIVTGLVRSEILQRIAERNDVEVTDAQVDDAFDQTVEQMGGREAFEQRLAAAGVSEELVRQQVRDQEIIVALQERVGGQDADFEDFIRGELERMPIEINPRYGEWDETSLQVRPSDPFAPAGGQAASEAASPAPER